jgi:hypothetical protein
MQKIPLTRWVVKEKIAFGNGVRFQAQIEDLRLKWCLPGRNSKNKITGSTPHSSYRHDQQWELYLHYCINGLNIKTF